MFRRGAHPHARIERVGFYAIMGALEEALMGSDIVIRQATTGDARALAAIYGPYVRDTAISFELTPPSPKEFAARIERTLAHYPYLVAERDGAIVGYAYAGPFKERAAYAVSAELSVYVDASCRRGGIGSALYAALEQRLAEMGVTNFYACIAYPPVEDEYLTYASVRFHEQRGYAIVGRFHGCSRKFGRAYDMVWMEKRVADGAHSPA